MSTNLKKIIRRSLVISSLVLFFGCAFFLIYYLIIQPEHSRQVTEKYRQIYYSASDNTMEKTTGSFDPKDNSIDISLDKNHKSGAKDSNGILLKFSKLLEYNSDIKGWLNIPGTNIDYPVMQAFNGSDFYLDRDFEGSKDKNGSLYIDGHCNIEKPTKAILIHGHNMDSTGMMFHQLLKYKDINFYKEHPVITFDSLYKESKWKIIAYVRLSGDMKKNQNFNYLTGKFKDKHDFMEFVYQMEMRSLYHCPVSVNEKDHLLLLSTCSYEVHDYRTVVVARRLRKNEDEKVDISKAYMRQDVLYPSNWYSKYGGDAPTVISFEDEMSFETPSWYDGKYTYNSAIGTTVTVDNNFYKILSRDEVQFTGCNNGNIKDLFIPSTVKIGERTYNVTSMSNDCLIYAYKLETLKIGNLIKEIPARAFINCSKLKSVIIGDSVEVIGDKAFYNLKELHKIKLRCTDLKTIGKKAFKGIALKAKFKIEESRLKKYAKLVNNSEVSKKSKLKFKTFKDEN